MCSGLWWRQGHASRPEEPASSVATSPKCATASRTWGPPTPDTPEVTVPAMLGTQGSSETGLLDARGAQAPSGESGPSSPAHVLVHREQESEGAGDLPQETDLGAEVGT